MASHSDGPIAEKNYLAWFEESGMSDVATIGGKGASLGEMYSSLTEKGIPIPNGFTVTVDAYAEFVDSEIDSTRWSGISEAEGLPGLRDSVMKAKTLRGAIHACFEGAKTSDHLEMHSRTSLARSLILNSVVPSDVEEQIESGYLLLCDEYGPGVDVAVRSSATVEDSVDASFAGQYDSYLNITGPRSVIFNWKRCVASLFTERAVTYQIDRGMNPLEASLAVVVMKMVRSDLSSSGVMFTLDPDSGHSGVIHISSSFGLGELLVQGSISPDGFLVWKKGLEQGLPAIVQRHLGGKEEKMIYSEDSETKTVDVSLEDKLSFSLKRTEVLELAKMALIIEQHYDRPMDIEWAKDGLSGEIFIVQARPETVHAKEKSTVLIRYHMSPKLVKQLHSNGSVLATGQAVGKRIGSGKVRQYQDYEAVISSKRNLRDRLATGTELESLEWEDRVFEEGDVLVTDMTTPDWEPMMKQASLIITRKGGRTSHAAIIAREFGIPAIVGATDVMQILEDGMVVTGSCAEGDDGLIFKGEQPFEIEEIVIDTDQKLKTKIKLNVGFPTKALADSMLPVDGVGLARIEFILSAEVGIHPMALVHYDALIEYAETGVVPNSLLPFRRGLERTNGKDRAELIRAISEKSRNSSNPKSLFIDELREGVGLICAAFYPRPVLVRLSDFKSNEYRELLGGVIFEPIEENPMIAWRGASRYVDPRFSQAFEMECEALQGVRHDMGLDNLQLMIPFCRSPEEGVAVKNILEKRNLGSKDGVPLFIMVELPSNVIEADRFIDEMQLDGGSIGTNDLVQTVYAVSRDDLEGYLHPVDARSSAVKTMVRRTIETFNEKGIEIGICGQAPSDHPEEYPPFLIECGITSISVTPDTAIAVRIAVEKAENNLQ
ncbi:MAG: phosphoenolpyruvate synthase [Candidatus Poseidoniaceae archaeon]|jgi:pyruvate,water dikinase|nr:phosphoenolpyruvate synthase [Candidatus Poseidoniaceae archaeon]